MFFKRKLVKISRISLKNLSLKNFNFYYLYNNFVINKFKYFFYLNFKFIEISNFNLKFLINFYNKKFLNFNFGTLRSILFNLVYGFKNFFFKKLILFGFNYKIFLKKNYIFIYMGYSHPIFLKIPIFIKIKLIQNEIFFLSYNKQKIFFFSNKIKNIKKFNVYKSKGFKYYNEKFLLKNIKKK